MTSAPLMQPDLNWFAVLAHHATRSPEKAITVFEGETTTYGEMARRATALAGGLAEQGVGRGDVVALLSYNSPEFLETVFAANYLGAIAMPINWRLAAPEVRYILEHSGSRALVCDDRLIDLARQAIKGMDGALVRVCAAPTTEVGWTSLADLRRPDWAEPCVHAGADDVHRLMYTSGTTGRPKGVMISHANLAWKNLAHIVEFGFTSHDLGLACGPLYHVGALDLTTTTLIAAGATTIIHRVFDPTDVVDELERSRVTAVWLAPAMVNAIMALPDIEQRDLSSVRVVINGGEKMPIPLIERVQRTFPRAWFADAYGLTETVSGDTFLDRRQPGQQARKRRPPLPLPRARHLGPGGGIGAGGGTRGDRDAGTEGLQGLLAGPRGDSRRVRRGVVPHRGRRRARRGRLSLHCGSVQGHDRLGRREHRQLGNRARAL